MFVIQVHAVYMMLAGAPGVVAVAQPVEPEELWLEPEEQLDPCVLLQQIQVDLRARLVIQDHAVLLVSGAHGDRVPNHAEEELREELGQ